MPWKLIIFAVTLLIVFVGGLYFLNEKVPIVEKPIHQMTSPVPLLSSKDSLPPKPKESFEYEKLLENKTVQVEHKKVTNRTATVQHQYQMQCGAYRVSKQAEQRKAHIVLNTGMEAKIMKTDNKKGSIWYRVVLGPYKSRRGAEINRHKLQSIDVECAIWYWTY